MQRRFLAVTLGIGLLGMLCLMPQQAGGGHGRACGGAFYGGPMYGGPMYGGPMYYGARTTTYYAPPAPYSAPMYGSSYPTGPAAYGQPYSSAPPSSARAYGQPYSSRQPSSGPTYGQSRSAPPARPTTTVTVAMYDNRFQPNSINVQPGTTVRWTNNGTHPHTITAKDETWDSGDIKPGATYSATFQQPGTYYYYCRHHAGMEGTIVVGQAASNGTASRRPAGY